MTSTPPAKATGPRTVFMVEGLRVEIDLSSTDSVARMPQTPNYSFVAEANPAYEAQAPFSYLEGAHGGAALDQRPRHRHL